MNANPSTARPSTPKGYKKFFHRKLGKIYLSQIVYGWPADFRYLRRWHKTASDAESYGKRFCDRYNRLLPAAVIEA